MTDTAERGPQALETKLSVTAKLKLARTVAAELTAAEPPPEEAARLLKKNEVPDARQEND